MTDEADAHLAKPVQHGGARIGRRGGGGGRCGGGGEVRWCRRGSRKRTKRRSRWRGRVLLLVQEPLHLAEDVVVELRHILLLPLLLLLLLASPPLLLIHGHALPQHRTRPAGSAANPFLTPP